MHLWLSPCPARFFLGSTGLLHPGPRLPCFWTRRGICPSWAQPSPTFSFLSLTWNQVEWPPCVSQVTTGFYNMETWRSVLLPGEVPQDQQALRTGDSSGFNRWD